MQLLSPSLKTSCLCWFFCVVSTVCVAAARAESPFFLVEDPWPPFTLGEAGGAPEGGLVVELMEELFQRIEQPLRMELYPWKRSIYMVRNQMADGLMLTVKTSEREAFAYFPEPFFVNKIQFFHKKDREFSWEKFSDLKDLIIGLVAGSKYSQEFQDAIQEFGLRTETVNSISINFHKLKAGRIDVTPVLDVVALKVIEDDHAFHGQFSPAVKPLKTTFMQMAISRSSPLMNHSDAIDRAIRDMKEDGTVQRVYREYVPVLHNHSPPHNGKCPLEQKAACK